MMLPPRIRWDGALGGRGGLRPDRRHGRFVVVDERLEHPGLRQAAGRLVRDDGAVAGRRVVGDGRVDDVELGRARGGAVGDDVAAAGPVVDVAAHLGALEEQVRAPADGVDGRGVLQGRAVGGGGAAAEGGVADGGVDRAGALAAGPDGATLVGARAGEDRAFDQQGGVTTTGHARPDGPTLVGRGVVREAALQDGERGSAVERVDLDRPTVGSVVVVEAAPLDGGGATGHEETRTEGPVVAGEGAVGHRQVASRVERRHVDGLVEGDALDADGPRVELQEPGAGVTGGERERVGPGAEELDARGEHRERAGQRDGASGLDADVGAGHAQAAVAAGGVSPAEVAERLAQGAVAVAGRGVVGRGVDLDLGPGDLDGDAGRRVGELRRVDREAAAGPLRRAPAATTTGAGGGAREPAAAAAATATEPAAAPAPAGPTGLGRRSAGATSAPVAVTPGQPRLAGTPGSAGSPRDERRPGAAGPTDRRGGTRRRRGARARVAAGPGGRQALAVRGALAAATPGDQEPRGSNARRCRAGGRRVGGAELDPGAAATAGAGRTGGGRAVHRTAGERRALLVAGRVAAGAATASHRGRAELHGARRADLGVQDLARGDRGGTGGAGAPPAVGTTAVTADRGDPHLQGALRHDVGGLAAHRAVGRDHACRGWDVRPGGDRRRHRQPSDDQRHDHCHCLCSRHPGSTLHVSSRQSRQGTKPARHNRGRSVATTPLTSSQTCCQRSVEPALDPETA